MLYSRIEGEGKPLLIIHGFLGMSDNWKSFSSLYAAEGFQVHLLDLRNHGRSFHSDDFSYALMAKDVFDYCQEHQLNHVNVIGHSMGGKTVMQFALNYPDSFSKMMVVDIAPKYYPVHHHMILQGLAAVDLPNLSSRTEANEILKRFEEKEGVRQFLIKNLFIKDRVMSDTNSIGLFYGSSTCYTEMAGEKIHRIAHGKIRVGAFPPRCRW